MEERFGKEKDVVISLATITLNPNEEGKSRPAVRNIDAYYEDGAFYSVTYGKSNKIQQITENSEVAIDVCMEWFTANGIGTNLGWVLDPKNAEMRTKLRKVFAAWYDHANNEQDQNCCILEVRLKNGVLIKDHGAVRYKIDFVNKTAVS
jgi:hypothetical protein